MVDGLVQDWSITSNQGGVSLKTKGIWDHDSSNFNTS